MNTAAHMVKIRVTIVTAIVTRTGGRQGAVRV